MSNLSSNPLPSADEVGATPVYVASPLRRRGPAPVFDGIDGETLLDTPDGPRPAREIGPGDAVLTGEGRTERVAVVWHVRLGAQDVDTYPTRRPVIIPAGSLGAERPAADLILGPDQIVVLDLPSVAHLFGHRTAHVRAGDLPVAVPLRRPADLHHFAFERFETIATPGLALGAACPDPDRMTLMDEADRSALLDALPRLAHRGAFAAYDDGALLLDSRECAAALNTLSTRDAVQATLDGHELPHPISLPCPLSEAAQSGSSHSAP
ncbi:MAG: Hint domain-containing protein [Pseudomonadota bacterium]